MSSKSPSLSVPKRIDILEAKVLELIETVNELKEIVGDLKKREGKSSKAKKAQSIDDEIGMDTECIIKSEKDYRFVAIDKLKSNEDCEISDVINQRAQYVCQMANCVKDSKMYCGSCGTVETLDSLQKLKVLCFCVDHRKFHVCAGKMKMKKVLQRCS